MRVLENLEPKKVFEFFEDICRIPHGSFNVAGISKYLADFAAERSLAYRQDEEGNVIIWKNASAGYENVETVILQGHMDMVAVKEEACEKDLEKEGLDLVVDGDRVFARGTSLGGDDGIAVAYALAVLDDDAIAHPPIEAIFTVNEEVGMLGADALDVSDLKGRLLINMDSEDEGIFTVSCAGGVSVIASLPIKREDADGFAMKIVLSGLTGGHSGVEIDKGRANANVMLGRILMEAGLADEELRLIAIRGGEKDNAIADFAEALILVKDREAVEMQIRTVFETIKKEYAVTDPDMQLSIPESEEGTFQALPRFASRAVVQLLNQAPAGIQRMNPEIKELVQTSLNLGVLTTEEESISAAFAVRSSLESEKDYLVKKLSALTKMLGGSVELQGDYPGWEYRSESRLRDVAAAVYRSQYREEPVIEGIHAGLECGLFASKLAGLDAISFGPQINHVHTTKEELSIASVARTWELLLGILKELR